MTQLLNENIEELEWQYLSKITTILIRNLDILKQKIQESLRYVEYLSFQIIMSSLGGRAYNPFSDMYEKHIINIVVSNFTKNGFKFLPLGYGSNIILESKELILDIDIKTANLENPSDYKGTINIGINQFSYPGLLPIKLNGKYYSDITGLRIWPNLPPTYHLKDSEKLVLTYGVLIIYPSYSNEINQIRASYEKLIDIVYNRIKELLENISNNKTAVKKFLTFSPKGSSKENGKIIAENVLREFFLFKKEREVEEVLNLTEDDIKSFENFRNKTKSFEKILEAKSPLPAAIIVISIPNGLLVNLYDKELVSGKDYGESVRYHYAEGKFKSEKLKDKPRVIIAYIDENYKSIIKSTFKGLNIANISNGELLLTKIEGTSLSKYSIKNSKK